MSSIVNKVKEALPGHHNKSSEPEGTHGTHSSRVANAADPRIDSDNDHSRNLGANPQGTSTTHSGTHSSVNPTHTSGVTGAHGAHGTHGTTGHSTTLGGSDHTHSSHTAGPASRTDGPHNSNLLNKADPRVDSDRDHSHNLGANPRGTATTGSSEMYGRDNTLGGTHSTHTAGHSTGVHAPEGVHGTHTSGAPEGTYGTHNSRVANAADPRVDSDGDRSRNFGANPQGTSTTHSGTHTGSGLHSTTGHNTGSGLHNNGPQSGLQSGAQSSFATGPAQNTAGPHKSDMLNKADPRVDSDLDGSKTYGGNKTLGS